MKRLLVLTTLLLLLACSTESDNPIVVADLFGDVVLNPSGNTPLAGEIPFHPLGAMNVVVSVAGMDGEDFSARLAVSDEASEVGIPILGLYAEHENEVTFTVENADGNVLGSHIVMIATETLPAGMPEIVVDGEHEAALFTFFGWMQQPIDRAEGIGVMVDRWGRVRWYSDFPIPDLHPLELWDGTLYTGDRKTALLRYDFLGNEILNLDFAEHGYRRIHHDIFKKTDGNLLLTVDKTGAELTEDRVIEIDPTRNSLRARWDLADVLPDVADLFYDLQMTGPQDPGMSDCPVHINALWFDDEDDTLLVCSQRSGVAEVYGSGSLKWMLAPHLIRWIDDADGDRVSDSMVDGYNPEMLLTHVGNFRGAAYVDERYPVNGQPVTDYSDFVFNYGEFLLTPLDAEGQEITDEDVLLGFANHEDFAWPFRPHSASLLPDGHLLLLDNGLGRNFGMPFSSQHYSRAVEYEIVEDASDGYGGTVRQVWEYRLGGEPPWHELSVMVGDVDALDNGHRLVVSGAIGSSFMLGTALEAYDGPHGALIVEVDPNTNEELHRLWLGRPADELPITQFSVYRASRVDPYAWWRERPLGSE